MVAKVKEVDADALGMSGLLVKDDPWRACLLAASLGGDCDTIAAMAGAIGGACHGLAAFPPDAVRVADGNGLGLAELADALLERRR